LAYAELAEEYKKQDGPEASISWLERAYNLLASDSALLDAEEEQLLIHVASELTRSMTTKKRTEDAVTAWALICDMKCSNTMLKPLLGLNVLYVDEAEFLNEYADLLLKGIEEIPLQEERFQIFLHIIAQLSEMAACRAIAVKALQHMLFRRLSSSHISAFLDITLVRLVNILIAKLDCFHAEPITCVREALDHLKANEIRTGPSATLACQMVRQNLQFSRHVLIKTASSSGNISKSLSRQGPMSLSMSAYPSVYMRLSTNPTHKMASLFGG
jgi:hypothetical protein